MATKIRKHTSSKKIIRFKRKKRISATLSGTAHRPRLSFFKSNAHLYVQVIDDDRSTTLVSASTLEQKIKNNLEGAKKLGQVIAKKALENNVKQIVFDRSGYIYHGKMKVLADAAREAGLQF